MAKLLFKYTAVFFSSIFNPFIIPTISFLIILYNVPGYEIYTPQVKYILMGIVVVSSCILPSTFLLLMSFTANINSKMIHHKDRVLPYIFSAFSIFLGAQLLGKLPIPSVFKLFMLGSCLVLVLLFLITLKWKISGHAAGVGGLLGSFLAITFKYGINIQWIIILLILISGAVCSSRIYMKKHTPSQVYTGFFLSLFVMYLTIYFF